MTDPRLARITERHRELLKDAAAAFAKEHGIQPGNLRASVDMVALFEIDDALGAILERKAQ